MSKLSRDLSQSSSSLTQIHLEHQEASSVHLWIGKDYVNWITKDLYEPNHPFSGNILKYEF